ncbi:hypothetical protein [Paenibacillus elgii]|uniref:hypothetical protein n=1 Tax=Paenibacillus elgii TaxID=189691 RepID=UPI000248D3AD|nr:hypothetical protein [Paenibacillus elgii]
MEKAAQLGNVVETYKIENSTISIYDGALAETPEENEKRINELRQMIWELCKKRMAESEVIQAYHQAATEAERDALLPALEAEGFTVVPKYAI